MHKRFFNALYVLNIVFQAFFDLLLPVALMFGLSYLLTSFAGAPPWIYAPLMILGVFLGLYSMVKFILSAMSALERLEREQNGGDGKENGKTEDEKE